MAKKSNLNSSRTNFDEELDIPDFDFDEPMPKDDRTPVTKFARGALDGASSALSSSNFIRKTIKATLPDGYGTALDLQEEVSRNAKQLYNNAAREIKPSLAEMARAAEKLTPDSNARVKAALAKIAKWGEQPGKSYSENDKEEQRNAGINASVNETLKFQMEESVKTEAKAEARGRLQEALDVSRHRESFGLLNSINTGISRLSQYQDRITSAYQKKSLELQYRSYFVSMDALEESKKQNSSVKEYLQGIVKNTGLPDYDKISEAERVKEFLRNKFAEKMSEGLMSGKDKIISKIFDHATSVINEKIQGMIGTFTSAATTMEEMADARDQAADSGVGGVTLSGLAAGSFSAEFLATAAGKKVKAALMKNEALVRGGKTIKRNLGSIPQDINEFKMGSKFENDTDIHSLMTTGKVGKVLGKTGETLGSGKIGQLLSFILRGSKEFIPGTGIDGSLEKDKVGDLSQRFQYTKQTHKSINEVIPGFLSRIFRELQVIRTGNANIDLTVYDFTKNKFLDKATASKNAFRSILSKDDQDATNKQLDDLLDDLDPKKELSDEARMALARKLLKDNLNTRSGKAERLSDNYTYSSDETTKKYADEISGVISKRFNVSPDGSVPTDDASLELQDRINSKFKATGNNIHDGRAQIQNLINLGDYETLADMGIVNEDHTKINFEKLMDYASGVTFNPEIQGVLGKNSTKRLPKQRTQTVIPIAPEPIVAPAMNLSNTASVTQNRPQHSSNEDVVKIGTTLDRIELLIAEGNMAQAGYFSNLVESLGAIGNSSGQNNDPKAKVDNGKIIQGFSVNMRNLLGKTTKLVGKGVSLGNKIGMSGLRGAASVLSTSLAAGKAIGTTALSIVGNLGQIKDLYMPGEIEPRLTEIGIKAGIYYDKASMKVITTLDDIKGAVVDVTGSKYYLKKDEIALSFLKMTKGGIFKIGRSIFSKLSRLSSFATSAIPPAISAALSVGNFFLDTAKDLLDQPLDIYIKGSTTPVMLARIMQASGYFLKGTTTVIRRPSQISGSVIDSTGKVVLTEEELKKGIFDYRGQPISSGLSKLLNMGRAAIGAGIRVAKNVFKTGVDMVKGTFKGVGKGIGRMIDGFAGGDTFNMLTNIYNVLNERLPGKKVRGDNDGDGLREGSWRSKKSKKAKDGKAAETGLTADKPKEAPDKKGIIDTIKDKYDTYRDIKDTLGDRDEKNKPGRKSKKRSSGMGRKALGIGGKLLGGAGLAAGAYGAYSNIKEGNYGSAALDAGMGLGSYALMGGSLSGLASGALAAGGTILSGAAAVGGGLMTGLGAAAAAVGTILASPVVLGALAIGAVAVGGYFAYKYFTAKSSKLTALRMTQYGFKADSEDAASKSIELENLASKAIVMTDGVAKLSDKKFDVKKALSIFNIDTKNEEAMDKWLNWFGNRFRAVYLTHVTAFNNIAGKIDLSEIDKLKPEEKVKYLELVKFDGGPYELSTNPIGTDGKNLADSGDVEAAYKLAKEEVDAEVAGKKSGAEGKAATLAAIGATTYDAAGNVTSSDSTPQGGDSYVSTNKSLKDFTKDSTSLASKGSSVITVTGELSKTPRVSTIDALEGIRMRAYGITTMESNKVGALRKLEDLILSKVTYDGSGKAVYKADLVDTIVAGGMFFGITNGSNEANTWTMWYQTRFLPIYLSYLGMIRQMTGSIAKPGIIPSLTPSQALSIATEISSIDGTWSVEESPWSNYKMGTDSSIVKEIIQGLRDAAKQEVLPEAIITKPSTVDSSTSIEATKDNSAKQAVAPKTQDKQETSPDAENPELNRAPTGSSGESKPSTGTLAMAGGPISDGRNVSRWMKFAGGVSLDGVNPALKKNFFGMVDEYGTLTGKATYVNSGSRTYQQQAALHAKDPSKAAKPGSSLHEQGLALDVQSSTLDDMDKLGLMRKYGFTRPVGGEPWHMEPAGIQGDIQGFKANPALATQAIEASLGKGGGGYGTLKDAKKYSRNGALAKEVMNASVSPKDNSGVKPPEVPAPTMAGVAPTAPPAALGKVVTAVSTAIYDDTGNMISGGIDSEPSIPKATAVVTSASAGNGKIDAFKTVVPGSTGKYASLPDSKGVGWTNNKDVILGSATMTGVDPKLLSSIIAVESGFNPMAKAGTSSASGLGQFTKTTWQESVDKHGKKYGIDPSTTPFDARANALMTAEYVKTNSRSLSSVKPNISATDIYLAHFLGAAGANKFLSADPNSIATQIMPDAAKSNYNIFYNGNTPRTIGEVYALLNEKVQTSLKKHGVSSDYMSAPSALAQVATKQTTPNTTTTPITSSAPSVITTAPTEPTKSSIYGSAPSSRGTSPSLTAAISPMADNGGFNLQSQPATNQNPRSDMTAAMGDVNNTLKQSLDVQKNMLDVLQKIFTAGSSPNNTARKDIITPVADDSSTKSYERIGPARDTQIPVRMNRV